MTETQKLLASYVRDGSEAAFRELVTSYFDLVYSTAVRLVDGDTHRAKDVAQVVFVDLAKMAGKLTSNSTLGGWLHRHTCFVARNTMRGERRRYARERHAAEMSALHDQSGSLLAVAAPVLDEAINELEQEDRMAIVLRFFERRSLRSVGEIMGITENVAQKRVARAVEELGSLLQKRRVALSTGVLASGLAAAAVKAAPAGLALGVASSVLASVGSGAGVGVGSTKALTVAKMKAAIAGGLVVGTIFTAVWMFNNQRTKPTSGQNLLAGQKAQQPAKKLATASDRVSRFAEMVGPKQGGEGTFGPDNRRTSAVSMGSEQTAAAIVQTNGDSRSAYLADPIVHLLAKPGSFVRIAGSSSVHDWQAESPFIGGYMDVSPNFPLVQRQEMRPGAVKAYLESFVTTRSLKSLEKDGKPYSDAMDEIMHQSLKADKFKIISYRLLEMSFQKTTNFNGARQYLFDTRGELAIAGVTNKIKMPVYIEPIGQGRVKISGTTSIKMTNFHVEPPTFARGGIKAGDNVDITFAWTLERTAASTKSEYHYESEASIPAESIKFFGSDIRQVLNIYAELAQVSIEVDENIKSLPVLIGFTNQNTVTRKEAVALLDNVLLEQAGIQVTHPMTNRAVMRFHN